MSAASDPKPNNNNQDSSSSSSSSSLLRPLYNLAQRLGAHLTLSSQSDQLDKLPKVQIPPQNASSDRDSITIPTDDPELPSGRKKVHFPVLSQLEPEYSFALLKRKYHQLRFRVERDEIQERELIILVFCMFALRRYILEELDEEFPAKGLTEKSQRAAERQYSTTTLWHLLNAKKLYEYESLLSKESTRLSPEREKEILDSLVDELLKYKGIEKADDVVEEFDSFEDFRVKMGLSQDLRLEAKRSNLDGEIQQLYTSELALESLIGAEGGDSPDKPKSSDAIPESVELFQDGVDMEEMGTVDREHYIPRAEQQPQQAPSRVQKSALEEEEDREIVNTPTKEPSPVARGSSTGMRRSYDVATAEG